MKAVYFDNAATTPVRGEVINSIQNALEKCFGNPSSTHSFGRTAKTAVEQARKTIAATLGAHPSEIIFTSGGTEADNMVLKCAVRDLGVKHIVTTTMEHHAVLHTVDELVAFNGVTAHHVAVDANGNPDLLDLEKILSGLKETVLVSLMHVNNEIGNILDLPTVAALCESYGAYLHSDTVQSIGHFPWDLQKIKIHFLAAAAHKFHGPKGIGFAYIRKDTPLKSFIVGGSQERGFRAGTEPYHNIVGLEKAFVLAYEHLDKERVYIEGLKKYFISEINKAIPAVSFNGFSGDMEKSTYTLVNVRLPFNAQKAQMLLFHLDLKGIACSKGSACQSGSNKGSHVLSAFLTKEQLAMPSLRFSFSSFNTKEEIDYTINVLKEFSEK